MQQSYKVAAVQAAPEFMNLDAGIDTAIALIAQAADHGARLIAFPECWLPGYPWWIWLGTAAENLRYFADYHNNCLVRDSEEMQRLQDTAREHGIFVSMGASERDHGSLYIAQFLIDDAGQMVQARRKLKPTHAERTVFGDGDGSDIDVFDTELGRVGQLSCWEHLQPLTKYAMYSLHEQLHIAAWPSFSCYPEAYALGPQLNNSVAQVYAAEGQCYVVAPCATVSQAMIETMVDTPLQAELLLEGGGYAQIFGPDGRPLCDALPPNEEGLLFADIDLQAIAIAKSFADPVGHYSRPDVMRLQLNRQPQPCVERLDPATALVNDEQEPVDAEDES
jgi:aliphatic nitrilase